MESNFILPKWTRELQRFLAIKPQFIYWGNCYDVYPIDIGGSITPLRLTDYLSVILSNEDYKVVLHYEPIVGFSVLHGDPDSVKSAIGETIDPQRPLKASLGSAADMISRSIANKNVSSAIIITFASRLPDIAKQEIDEFYYMMARQCHIAEQRKMPECEYLRFNPVIWMLDKENDIPAWYTVDNPKAKVISIPKPDFAVRRTIIESLSPSIPGYQSLDEKGKSEQISIFIDQTNSLFANEIISIISLAKREKVEFSEIAEAIRRYKLGIIENPWTKLDSNKIENSDELLSKRVKGQENAIRLASDIIKRSIYSLSGSQYSKYSSRPKGVLFFAGPTGVGKTELAKALTELIFGSETSYIRFDMTEFRHDHADQRLVGSPPGYVGYDVGGELTNAVKQNPFAVVLFDEIEKAHPKILDLFMQMIDDGRLTSGRGETVYFSECLLIFTSNLGMFEVTPDGREIQRVDSSMEYSKIETEILGAIDHYFKFKISRPEILNRIGKNIIVFDFIRQNIAEQIFDKMLNNVLEKVRDAQKIELKLSDQARTQLVENCCTDLSMGGRGIGNQLEEVFINPLSRSLYASHAQAGQIFTISNVEKRENDWEVIFNSSESVSESKENPTSEPLLTYVRICPACNTQNPPSMNECVECKADISLTAPVQIQK